MRQDRLAVFAGVCVVIILVGAAGGCKQPGGSGTAMPGGSAPRQAATPPAAEPSAATAQAPSNEEKQASSGSGEIQWITSYSEGMAKAKAEGKPVMIDLYADWCGPCRMLDEKTWSDPEVQQAAARFVCIKVNVDEDEETARKYGASSIPLVVFLSPDGKELSRNVGFVGPDKMLPLMMKAAGG